MKSLSLLPTPVVRLAAITTLALALGGCTTDLYTKQTEADANAMVSALLEKGVDARKQSTDGGKTWNVAVDGEDVVRSLAVLKAQGLPAIRHVTLGELFKKEGLISTPTEERIRFIHGVSQELETTLSLIDGVVSARVHIVLPNNDPLATEVKPSSASVFIKYRSTANLTALTPAIKNMVGRSVEGLSYDNVAVTLVPGTIVVPDAPVRAASAWLWALSGSLLAALLSGLGWVAWRRPGWLPPAIANRLPRWGAAATAPATKPEAA